MTLIIPKWLVITVGVIIVLSLNAGGAWYGYKYVYEARYDEGFNAGRSAGQSAGFAIGKSEGYESGKTAGLSEGYNIGWDAHIAELKKVPIRKLDVGDAKNLLEIFMKANFISETRNYYCWTLYTTDFYYWEERRSWVGNVAPSTKPGCERPKKMTFLINDQTQEVSIYTGN